MKRCIILLLVLLLLLSGGIAQAATHTLWDMPLSITPDAFAQFMEARLAIPLQQRETETAIFVETEKGSGLKWFDFKVDLNAHFMKETGHLSNIAILFEDTFDDKMPVESKRTIFEQYMQKFNDFEHRYGRFTLAFLKQNLHGEYVNYALPMIGANINWGRVFDQMVAHNELSQMQIHWDNLSLNLTSGPSMMVEAIWILPEAEALDEDTLLTFPPAPDLSDAF